MVGGRTTQTAEKPDRDRESLDSTRSIDSKEADEYLQLVKRSDQLKIDGTVKVLLAALRELFAELTPNRFDQLKIDAAEKLGQAVTRELVAELDKSKEKQANIIDRKYRSKTNGPIDEQQKDELLELHRYADQLKIEASTRIQRELFAALNASTKEQAKVIARNAKDCK